MFIFQKNKWHSRSLLYKSFEKLLGTLWNFYYTKWGNSIVINHSSHVSVMTQTHNTDSSISCQTNQWALVVKLSWRHTRIISRSAHRTYLSVILSSSLLSTPSSVVSFPEMGRVEAGDLELVRQRGLGLDEAPQWGSPWCVRSWHP